MPPKAQALVYPHKQNQLSWVCGPSNPTLQACSAVGPDLSCHISNTSHIHSISPQATSTLWWHSRQDNNGTQQCQRQRKTQIQATALMLRYARRSKWQYRMHHPRPTPQINNLRPVRMTTALRGATSTMKYPTQPVLVKQVIKGLTLAQIRT